MEENTKVNKNKLQGVKNFFGKTNPILKKLVGNTSVALQDLSNEANSSCKELKVDKDNIKNKVHDVWEKLIEALKELKNLSETTEDSSSKGKGRAFANYILGNWKIRKILENLGNIDGLNVFGEDVGVLQIIANKTPYSSSIPSWIDTAASNTTSFFAWAFAYYTALSPGMDKVEPDIKNLEKLNEISNEVNAYKKNLKSKISYVRKWENFKSILKYPSNKITGWLGKLKKK